MTDAARNDELADWKQAASVEASLRREFQKAEADLSAAYLRLRSMIPGAFNTPHAPTGEQVWETTENALKAALARSPGGPGNHFVRCDDCLAGSNDVGRDRAVELWNRRAGASAQSSPDYFEVAGKLGAALVQIADMDPKECRADDLGRAARIAREALAPSVPSTSRGTEA